LNALTYETPEEIEGGLKRAKSDPETKVILITGAGEKAFIAGADFNELALLNPMTGKEVSEKGQALTMILESLGKPTIAVVNGYALGGMDRNCSCMHHGSRITQCEVWPS
jgi:enoyl-CoA hydratase